MHDARPGKGILLPDGQRWSTVCFDCGITDRGKSSFARLAAIRLRLLRSTRDVPPP